MLAPLIKALGFSLGCSCPNNCQPSQPTTLIADEIVLTTISIPETEKPDAFTADLSGIQDIDKIYAL